MAIYLVEARATPILYISCCRRPIISRESRIIAYYIKISANAREVLLLAFECKLGRRPVDGFSGCQRLP
jgi:hypothetical protein